MCSLSIYNVPSPNSLSLPNSLFLLPQIKSNLSQQYFLSSSIFFSSQILGFIAHSMAAEKLRDLTQPIDVPLLDATVAAFYGTGSKEQVASSSFSSFLFFPLRLHYSTFSPICLFLASL